MEVPETTKKMIKARVQDMETLRESWEDTWRDIRDYLLPYHGYALDSNSSYEAQDGEREGLKIIDDTATDALDVLAAGLMSGLTSPAQKWFKLTLADPSQRDSRENKQYLEDVEKVLYDLFARSNFYQTTQNVYLELGAFGTAAMAINESFETGIHCRHFTIGEYTIAASAEGTIDTVYREVFLTARQIVNTWGIENVSNGVKRAYENKPEEEFPVSHLVEPNDDRIELKDAQGRAFRSIYWEREDASPRVLGVRGFDEFPIMAPRWNAPSNRIYGNGPGHKKLGDIKMLQKLNEKQLIAIDKEIDPPLRAPGALKTELINTMPGGLTYDESIGSGANAGVAPVYQVRHNIRDTEMKIDATQRRIREGFFNQLFMLIAQTDKTMTAQEVRIRQEEKLIMLGPVLTRLYSDFLKPAIDRTFSIADRLDLLPEAPPSLAGAEVQVEFTSILAQAQKMVGLQNIERTVAFFGNVSGAKPEILDRLDADQLADHYAELQGVPTDIIVPVDEANRARQQRAQQIAAQQAAETAKTAADAAKVMSETEVRGSSALDLMAGGPGI